MLNFFIYYNLIVHKYFQSLLLKVGSIEQAVDAFYDAGLLDEEFFGNASFSSASKYNETICSNNETDSSTPTCDEYYGNNKIPEYGPSFIQVDTQGGKSP